MFWPTLLLFAPLLWVQGRYTRWRTPRLSPAQGDAHGKLGTSTVARRVLIIGESPVVGVGVEHFDESLPAQIAAALAETSHDSWHWMAIGENGATLDRMLALLSTATAVPTADVIVIVAGVNDTTTLRSRGKWRQDLRALVAALREQSNAPIVFTPVPPMHSFTALPQPLRLTLALRASSLNRDMRAVFEQSRDIHCCPPLPTLGPQHLAADGYHPSAAACTEWGQRIAQFITQNQIGQSAHE